MGRPKGSLNKHKRISAEMRQRLQNVATTPLTARELLAMLNEPELWRKAVNFAIEQQDARALVQILTYLTDRRDGKSLQQVKLEVQQPPHHDAADLQNARAIAREIQAMQQDAITDPTRLLQ